MTLASYEYRDPEQVLVDVLARMPMSPGDVVFALVREPSGDQEVVEVVRLGAQEQQVDDEYAQSRLLADIAQALPIPEDAAPGGPRHSIMTIIARNGLCVVGGAEGKWLVAWLYSNHLTNAFAGELILMTEHGWRDFTTGLGAPQPRLTQALTQRRSDAS